ncbi:MAG: M28 family peptidase [Gemmatimonadales bacterium]|nr:M28 family peptidase [Gemmatimonadales bacterium]
MIRSSVLLLAVLTTPLAAQGRSPTSKIFWPDEGVRTFTARATKPEITADDLRARLYQFADDSMMGREAGTLGNWKATEYIAREYKRIGLVPAGENGTYFQEIQYGQLRYDSTKVRLIAAGTALQLGTDWMPVIPSAALQLAGTFGASNDAVVYGGRWMDSTVTLTPAMVRGKIVVFAPAAPAGPRPANTPAPRDYRASEAGAAAILLVGELSTRIAITGRNGLMPTVPGNTAAASITPAAAATLFDTPLDQLAPGTAGKAVTGAWTYEYTAPEYPARNVIGVLPGSDPVLHHQYVLIGAHNDHVGMVRGSVMPEHDSLRAFNKVMRPQGANDRVSMESVTPAQWKQINDLIAGARKVRPARADSVNNGADDDGSGTVVLLEIAERMASQPAPKRSMIFISHTAEEKGLLGSMWWTDHPTLPRDSIVAAHNMDMLGKGRVTDVRFGGPASVQMLGSRRLSAEFGDVIDSLNAVRSEPMVIDYSWDRTNALNRFCRSDQVSYFRFAIPVTYFSLGYAVDYHQPTDEPQYIDYVHGARVGRFVEEIARTVANRAERLKVNPVGERDLSARC